MLQFFNLFGPISYAMLAVCIFILAIIFERMITYSFIPRFPRRKLKYIEYFIQNAEHQQALQEVESLPQRIQGCLLALFEDNPELAKQDISLHLVHVRRRLQQPLLWLNLMAVVSPMLGLLGTIWSMSHSFAALADSFSGGDLETLIRYLSEAMWATAFGIVLALVSLCALYLFRQWSDNYLNQLEYKLNRLAIHIARNLA